MLCLVSLGQRIVAISQLREKCPGIEAVEASERLDQEKSICLMHHVNMSLIVLPFRLVGLTFSTTLPQCLHLRVYTDPLHVPKTKLWKINCSWTETFHCQIGQNKGCEIFSWCQSGYSFRSLTIIKTVATQKSWNCSENNINITTVSRWKNYSQFHKCQFKWLFCASIQQLSKW